MNHQTDQIVKAMMAMDTRATRRQNRVMTGARGLEQVLSQGHPGGWSSDHRAEAMACAGWNYVAVNAIATQAFQAEVNAYLPATRKTKALYNLESDDTQPVDVDHPVIKHLKRPNPKQSGGSFRYEQAMQLRLTGACLVWKVPNRAGKTVHRYIIPTAIAEPKPPCDEYPEGWYRIKPELARVGSTQGWFFAGQLMSSAGYALDAREVQVTMYPHPLFRDDGLSPSSAGAVWMDQAKMIDSARWGHMKRGPDPSVAVSIEGFNGDQADLERIKSKFNAQYAGTDRSGTAMFLTNDSEGNSIKVTPLGHKAREMMYGESFIQMRDAILAIHGVPPLAAGIEQASGNDGLYAPLKQFTWFTVQPLLDLLAEEDTESWGWQYGEGMTLEYTAKTIDEPDQARADTEQLIGAGAITKGELRTLRGMELFGDERDDELAGPSQPAVPEEEDEPDGDDALERIESMVKGLASRVDELAKPKLTTAERFRVPELVPSVNGKAKAKRDCGANAPGGGGFQPGNTCAGGKGSSSEPDARRLTKSQPNLSSTQFNLPETAAAKVRALQAQIDPADLAPDGFEFEPHVTVKYGLETTDPEPVKAAVKGMRPVTVTLGALGVFEGDDHDVLYVEAEGDALRVMNEKLSELPNQDEHTEYRPHVTLAYLQKGAAQKYLENEEISAGLGGTTVKFKKLLFSDPARNKKTIYLQ